MTDAWLDATATAAAIRAGECSPLEAVDEAIARIEKLNPELNAVIHPMFERARAEAASPDLPDGPFRGVPFLMKDLGCHVAGEPMCEGMAFLKEHGWVEQHETALARRFREAGLITLGKTNTPELGILPTTEPDAFGPTRNPWNLGHSTGGSSGGSAAAVAAGLVPVAHANDGGGSIRIPASECGLVGLKPSRARVSLMPEWGDIMGGLVCEHVVTRSVRDTAGVLDCVAGPEPGDPYAAPTPARPFLAEVGADPGRLKIGLMVTAAGVAVDPECAAAASATGKLLEGLGHHVEVAHPAALDDPDYTNHFITMWSAGTTWSVDSWSRKVGAPITEADVEPLTWALSELGRSFSASQWLLAREWLQVNTGQLASWWAGDDGFDLLLTPTIAQLPPPLGTYAPQPGNPLNGIMVAAGIVPFTPPFNVSGQPGISLPLHWSESGLPIGSQLVAAYGREDLLIAVAAQLEAAAPWADRRPPVSA